MCANARNDFDRYRIRPGSKVDLDRIEADETAAFDGGKEAAQAVFERLNDRLEELQELLWARQKEKILVVLQGMDTAGKDGVIRHVFDGVNPAGVRVASFKVPTAEELARDFLWRVHARVPGAGEMVIFNRSHYEDVLVPVVNGWIDAGETKRRYAQINDFERMLTETGTIVAKFMLHISKDEQRERLQQRLDDPAKRWKFALGDLDVRNQWDAYRAAYQQAIAATGTRWAPWTIVPADSKLHRNLMIASVLKELLLGLKLRYPTGDHSLEGVRVD